MTPVWTKRAIRMITKQAMKRTLAWGWRIVRFINSRRATQRSSSSEFINVVFERFEYRLSDSSPEEFVILLKAPNSADFTRLRRILKSIKCNYRYTKVVWTNLQIAPWLFLEVFVRRPLYYRKNTTSNGRCVWTFFLYPLIEGSIVSKQYVYEGPTFPHGPNMRG